MIARLAARPVIGYELAQRPAGEFLTAAAMLDASLQTAGHKPTVRVLGCDTSGTPARMVGALAAVIAAASCECLVFHIRPVPPIPSRIRSEV